MLSGRIIYRNYFSNVQIMDFDVLCIRRVSFLTFICPALSDFATLLLNLLPCNPVDYRSMHIFEHHHVFRIIIKPLFVFVRFRISFEINQISTILL